MAVPFDSFHLFLGPRSLFTCRTSRPPSKALINKRKLRKPVGTSEKEATDKKKKEKNEEEEEEEDEEVATKSSAHTAMRSSGLVRTSFVKVWYRIRALNNITIIGPVGYLIIHHVKLAHLPISCTHDIGHEQR